MKGNTLSLNELHCLLSTSYMVKHLISAAFHLVNLRYVWCLLCFIVLKEQTQYGVWIAYCENKKKTKKNWVEFRSFSSFRVNFTETKYAVCMKQYDECNPYMRVCNDLMQYFNDVFSIVIVFKGRTIIRW